jgi:hypothetical protein
VQGECHQQLLESSKAAATIGLAPGIDDTESTIVADLAIDL